MNLNNNIMTLEIIKTTNKKFYKAYLIAQTGIRLQVTETEALSICDNYDGTVPLKVDIWEMDVS
jgi:hypothetical protein